MRSLATPILSTIAFLVHHSAYGAPLTYECMNSISQKYEKRINDSFTEGEKNYKGYGDFEFGKIKDQPYIQYGEQVVYISEIKFKNPNDQNIEVESQSISIDLSDLHTRNYSDHKIYCLIAPLSGLGSNGKFQRYAALIAVATRNDRLSQIEGKIIRRR